MMKNKSYQLLKGIDLEQKKRTSMQTKALLLLCFSAAAMVATTRKFTSRDYRGEESVLDQETRRTIYELIKNKPGLHFRNICRQLDKRMGVVQYHISVLEKTNYIRSVKDGRYKCFFAIENDNGYQNKNLNTDPQMLEVIITSLRRKTPKMLLEYLVSASATRASHQELSSICEVSPQAITFHCQRLEKNNIIESKKEGRQKYYSLTEQAAKIIGTLL